MTVVNLSSRTGFTQKSKQKIWFHKTAALCGKSGVPGEAAPKALKAQAWK